MTVDQSLPTGIDQPAPVAFEADGPLPGAGVTLLEASAGTGKTFTIAALAARYVAGGLPLDRLLIVTFTRMATGELRERVRERLVSAAEGLGAVLDGVLPEKDDEILCLLAAGDVSEVEERRARLARAVADFDAATIETTHGFCLQVLSGLGTAGDVERDVSLVEDATDVLEEVVDDLYIRRFWAHPDDLFFERPEAMRIGEAVLRHPMAAIVPPLSAARDARAIRRRLADAVAEEIERRKRLAGILTYDDVLIRLRDTLQEPVRGPTACDRLSSRYEVVLVDEFQDTDPVQWDIMRLAFGQGTCTLVLIGDPKQAIYAFRGADVFAYLEAAASADLQATLTVNWRSDHGLIAAYDALFADSQLGHAGIAYRRVRAAGANETPRLVGAPRQAALGVRLLRRSSGLVSLTDKGYVSSAPARQLIARDLAGDVVDLLSSGAVIVHRRLDGTETNREPVRPGHLAVLVRTNKQAGIVRDALHDASVPAVIGGAGSVFATIPAAEWLDLLGALERPTARDRAAAAALTSFIGWTPLELATAGDDEWEELHWSLHRSAALLRRRGVAALLENLTVTRQLPARVLARPSGERFLTDLRHVGQLLHAAALAEGLGTTALSAWLRRRIAEAEEDTGDEDRSRRLESDAEAVQVLTIHRSKGLEFPVVYCPFVWEGWTQIDKVPVFHDPANGDRRTIDVGITTSDGRLRTPSQERALVESRGEDLRLLYVALTRAKHQAVVWWAGAYESELSSFARLLFAREDSGVVSPFGQGNLSDDDVAERISRLGGGVVLEEVGPVDLRRWAGGVPAFRELEVETFRRILDERWRRVSYTSLTAAAHEQIVTSEPEDDVTDDEAMPGTSMAGRREGEEAAGAASLPLLLGDMPAGARVGTLVHAVMETTDFATPDLTAALRVALDAQLSWQHFDIGDPETVVAGLATAIDSPLGPLVGDLRLRQVGRGDRVDEMGFELPLAGGDRPHGEISVPDIAQLLRMHIDPADPMSAYAARLDDPSLGGVLRGYLTGSLDLTFRTEEGRFLVVDYKTNRLPSAGASLTAWDYRPQALTAAMEAAHYPLQAILYTVALHRYLRWRLEGYAPEDHLGGVLYLFLRGMSHPGFPTFAGSPSGVWSWRPPASLIVALSDLFETGGAMA